MIDAACNPSRSGIRDFGVKNRDSTPAVVDVPLLALEGSALADRFRHWRGRSGRRHLFSVFPLCPGASDASPRYDDAVVMAVAQSPDGGRRIVWAGLTGLLPDLVFDGMVMREAVAQGANEIHIHLLAKDDASRAALIRDIAG